MKSVPGLINVQTEGGEEEKFEHIFILSIETPGVSGKVGPAAVDSSVTSTTKEECQRQKHRHQKSYEIPRMQVRHKRRLPK